jgi:hypothetical protein
VGATWGKWRVIGVLSGGLEDGVGAAESVARSLQQQPQALALRGQQRSAQRVLGLLPSVPHRQCGAAALRREREGNAACVVGVDPSLQQPGRLHALRHDGGGGLGDAQACRQLADSERALSQERVEAAAQAVVNRGTGQRRAKLLLQEAGDVQEEMQQGLGRRRWNGHGFQ